MVPEKKYSPLFSASSGRAGNRIIILKIQGEWDSNFESSDQIVPIMRFSAFLKVHKSPNIFFD